MSLSGLERLAPLTGVAFVVLVVVGGLVQGDSPDFLDDSETIASYYTDDSGQIMASSYLTMLAIPFLIWFVGTLRSRLRAVEVEGRLAGIAFAGGIAGATLLLASAITNAAAALRADEDAGIDPATATTLFDLSGALFGFSGLAFAALVGASAVVALRFGGPLPRWLAWVSLALLIGLLTPYAWIFVLLTGIWILVVAVLLYTRPPSPAAGGPGIASPG
jgi:hypothetical protein